MTFEDALAMFEEMPRRVQVAILSHLHGMRSRGSIQFSEYDRVVAEYIEYSGLMRVKFTDGGGVRFYANENTELLKPHMRALLEAYGFVLGGE